MDKAPIGLSIWKILLNGRDFNGCEGCEGAGVGSVYVAG